MKALALATALAFASFLPALAVADDDAHFLNLGPQAKVSRITQADSDKAAAHLRLRYAIMEAQDEEDDIASSEEAERLLKLLSPEELQITMRILGADLEAE